MRTDFGGGSLRSKLVGLVIRNSAKRVIFAWTVVPNAPWPYFVVDHLGRFQKRVHGTTCERVVLPNCPASIIRTPGSDPKRHVLYFHGGAFLVGGQRLHQALVSRIADATQATVLSVGYRKLPRHPVSTSAADGLDGYRHLLDSGVDPADVVFMGDSAGGFLTFTVADLAIQEGLPAPSAIVAMSPLVDFDFARTALAALRRGDAVFGRRSFPRFALLAARREPTGRVHSPVDCALGALPPVLLQVSSSEILYPQVCRMAELLEEAGVPTDLQVWDGQVHVFQAARPLPEAQQAVAEIGAFVDRALASARRQSA